MSDDKPGTIHHLDGRAGRLGVEIRRLYDDVMREPVPADMQALAADLEAALSAGAPDPSRPDPSQLGLMPGDGALAAAEPDSGAEAPRPRPAERGD